jgi:hypothetical protein
LFGTIGFVATLSSIFGPVWPTTPLFSPGAPSFGHPLDVPFTVSNTSTLFDVYALKINCTIVNVIVSTNRFDGNTVSFSAVHILRAGEKRPYTCPFHPSFSVAEPWGSPENKVLEATIQFNIEYSIVWGLVDMSARAG